MITSVLGIDQSLTGTAICLLDDSDSSPRPSVLETFAYDEKSKVVGMRRLQEIVGRITKVLDEHSPDLVVMEDYAMGIGKGTNNITRLAELGGIIKWEAARRGYQLGYGTGRNASERAEAWDVTQRASKVFAVQTAGQMKKFCLGDGATKKDSRYLLTVHEHLHRSFDNDNEADAYMHAHMGGIVIGVVRGEIPISNLPEYQQEVLLEPNRKSRKALSMKQLLRLSDAEKLELLKL